MPAVASPQKLFNARLEEKARDQRAQEWRSATALPEAFYVAERHAAEEVEGGGAADELAEIEALSEETAEDIEGKGWRYWLDAVFPGSFGAFAERHVQAWDFVWSVTAEGDYPAQVDIWPRGGGKSTTLEKACVAWGARGTRKFVAYVRETQEQANASVQNIADALQSPGVERFYPALADRAVNKFGRTRKYTQKALITRSGFIVVGIGLDAAARGLKIGDFRPDVIILDDIDHLEDTPAATRKKIRTITNTILPLGTNETLVWMIQNLIHPNSIAARLADGRADFMLNRKVRGPIPALHKLKTVYEYVEELGKKAPVIKSGVPTWKGQDVQACQSLIFRLGLRSFLREQQHKVKLVEGALWKQEEIDEHRVTGQDQPEGYLYTVVGIDPSGNRGKEEQKGGDGEKSGGNECGIIVQSLGYDGKIYTRADLSLHARPAEWAKVALEAALEYDADEIVAEKNFGGEMVRETIHLVAQTMGYEIPPVHVELVTASRGKAVRAEPSSGLMPEGRNPFVGDFPELEEELTTWTPDSKESPNRLDAFVWGAHRLMRYLRHRNRKSRIPGSTVVGTSA